MAYEGIWSDQATEDGVKKLKADIRAKYANTGADSTARTVTARTVGNTPKGFNYNVDQKKKLSNVQQKLSDNQAIAAEDRTLFNEYQKSGFENQIKRIGNQGSARQGLKDNQFDFADLSKYDSSSAGNKKFGMGDVKYLKQRGTTDDAIKAHINSLGAEGISEKLRYNKDYAGDNYVGDIGNTGDISNFDVGKGYNIWDINYLKGQGYSDKQISNDMMKRIDKDFGAESAGYLNDQGRLEEWESRRYGTNNTDKRLEKAQKKLSDNQAIAAGDRTLFDEYQQKGFKNQIKRINNQNAARQGLQDDRFKYDNLSNYNSAAAGGKNFGMADIKYLKKRGVSDAAIKSHIKSLGGKGIDESLRYNKEFGGDQYVGDIGNTGDISNFDVGKGYNITDIKYLKGQGYSDQQIADDMMNRTNKGFGAASAKFLNDQGRLEEWKEAKERAQSAANNSVNNSNNQTITNTNTNIENTDNSNKEINQSADMTLDASSTNINKVNDSYNTDFNDSFNTDIRNTNTVDNSTTTTIGNSNTFGAGANIGNNNAVTITNQGGPDAQGGTGLNNMQSIAAYSALNNNQAAQSNQMLNGYGRSAGAISEAQKTLGIQDRVANIYNMQGLTQGYWGNKAISHQADYLGDIWKSGGFKFMMPGKYTPMEDKTEEIASGLNF
jgi:hypothetical protein